MSVHCEEGSPCYRHHRSARNSIFFEEKFAAQKMATIVHEGKEG